VNDWQQTLDSLRRAGTPAVLVSVDSSVGSTPRESGAKMIVTADRLYGTIGGGNLEYQACRIAREQLEAGDDGGPGLRRFPLGAGLGQCCGGLVNLMFERLGAHGDWSRAAIDEGRIDLYLFGAGHVGRALVHVLRDLPVEIRWIDTRDDMLPPNPPPGVTTVCTDTPEAEIDAAPAGACFLVMSHDHGLDQRLCELHAHPDLAGSELGQATDLRLGALPQPGLRQQIQATQSRRQPVGLWLEAASRQPGRVPGTEQIGRHDGVVGNRFTDHTPERHPRR